MAASTRWIVLAALAAGIASVGALNGAASPGKSQATTRPNVIVFETDDQTVESMRVMPNVKSLIADQGVTFDNSFVSYSLCCPSRATFLTGQYAHNHGVMGNAAPNGGYYKLDSSEHASRLAAARRLPDDPPRQVPEQYGTKNAREIPPGWGQWYGTPDPSTYRYRNYTINENGTLVNFGDAPRPTTRPTSKRGWAVDLIDAPGRRSAAVLPVGHVPRAALGRAEGSGRPERDLDARRRRLATANHFVERAAARAAVAERGRRLRQAGRRSATVRC